MRGKELNEVKKKKSTLQKMGGGRTKEVHNSFNSRVITENLKIRARQFMPCDNLIFLRTTDISSTTGMKFCY